MKRIAYVFLFAIFGLPVRAARADEAVITVGRADPRPAMVYAPPPTQPPAPAAQAVLPDPDATLPHELYRSPFRFQVVGTGVTTGKGLGPGMGISVDFGSDAVGFRLSASWMRGEPGVSPLADGLAQYTAEFTYDFAHRSTLHPVFGLGFGLAHVNRDGGASGSLGVAVARFGLEYAVPVQSADVRFALGVTGALPGPADSNVGDVRSYAIVGAGVGVGF